jgi:hypothetical protein
MTQQHIKLGTLADGRDGDTNRAAWEKAEANFSELYGGALNASAFKNLLINGNFDFWQRGLNLEPATGLRYLADRWMTIALGVTTIAASRQGFTLGQLVVPNSPKSFHRLVVASTPGAANAAVLDQRIERVDTLAGKTATLSFWAKAESPKSIAVEFVQSFGTGGNPSADVTGIGVAKLNLTSAWQKFVVTATIPPVTGSLGTSGTDCLRVLFWMDAGSNFNTRTNALGNQSGTFDFAQIQLEEGASATSFEHRPFETELSLCQRYFEKSFDLLTTPAGQVVGSHFYVGMPYAATAMRSGLISFKTRKRSGANITLYSSNVQSSAGGDKWIYYGNNSAWITPTGQSVNWATDIGFNVDIYNSGGGMGFGQASILSGHWTAEAEL